MSGIFLNFQNLFNSILAIFECLPFVVQGLITSLFGIVIIFSILKMIQR